uniref:G_PROTEIN_RECEP_F1_2 domain-containing protein n=1 Tax=Panagrellus redivivus TaxID=6233 RepID=A0A7E4W3S0_PANRE
MNVICVVMALHGTIDMGCTLYFVKPYWRYCQSLWMKVKPFAGGPGGIFRSVATSQLTSICAAIGIILVIHTAIGVFLSLINRLSTMFGASAIQYLHNKKALTGIVLFHVFSYILVAFFLTWTMDSNANIRKTILLETNNALIPYFDEPSLMYVSELDGLTRKICIGYLIVVAISTLLLIGCVIIFVIKVKHYKSNNDSISKVSVSLIVSSLIQAFLCVACLFLPLGYLGYIWGFNIKGSANPFNIMCIVIGLHGTIDMSCTLYFVKPYWRYCQSLWMKVKPFPSGSDQNVNPLGRRQFGEALLRGTGVDDDVGRQQQIVCQQIPANLMT